MRNILLYIASGLCLAANHVSLMAQAEPQRLNMTLLSRWDLESLPVHFGLKYNDVWGYADCNGREYAIFGSAGRVHFIEVTDPVQPREIASFPGTSNSIWRDFKTYRNRAYASADEGNDGLRVFDLSRLPDTVVMTYASTQVFQRSHNLWVDTLHGRLYMAGANTRLNGVIIYDLTQNPDEPQLLASVPLPGGYVHDIHVVDHIGYASHANEGLWVYDFTNPSQPVVLGAMTEYPEKGYNHSSWLSADRNWLVMADETHGAGVKLVDVRDPSNIRVRSIFRSALLPGNSGSILHNPFIRDQYVIMAYYHDGIQIFDMSNPDSVTRVAFYDTYPINTNYSGYQGAWGTYPYLPSGNILGADITFGLHVLRADSIQFAPGPRHRFPQVLIEPAEPSFCAGEAVELEVTPGALEYQWYFNDTLITGATSPALSVNQAGAYQAEARNGHCVAYSALVNVEEWQPEQPRILQVGQILECVEASRFSSFQWYLDDQPIPGATQSQYLAEHAGRYTLETTDLNGCRAVSEPVQVVVSSLTEAFLPSTVQIYPNPASGGQRIFLKMAVGHPRAESLLVRDALGRACAKLTIANADAAEIQLPLLPQGLYWLELQAADGKPAGVARLVMK